MCDANVILGYWSLVVDGWGSAAVPVTRVTELGGEANLHNEFEYHG